MVSIFFSWDKKVYGRERMSDRDPKANNQGETSGQNFICECSLHSCSAVWNAVKSLIKLQQQYIKCSMRNSMVKCYKLLDKISLFTKIAPAPTTKSIKPNGKT